LEENLASKFNVGSMTMTRDAVGERQTENQMTKASAWKQRS